MLWSSSNWLDAVSWDMNKHISTRVWNKLDDLDIFSNSCFPLQELFKEAGDLFRYSGTTINWFSSPKSADSGSKPFWWLRVFCTDNDWTCRTGMPRLISHLSLLMLFYFCKPMNDVMYFFYYWILTSPICDCTNAEQQHTTDSLPVILTKYKEWHRNGAQDFILWINTGWSSCLANQWCVALQSLLW